MSWKGQWITGIRGARKLAHLNNIAQLQNLRSTVELGKEAKMYMPWMSNARLRKRWPTDLEKPSGRRIQSESWRLRALRNVWKKGSVPLGEIAPENESKDIEIDPKALAAFLPEMRALLTGLEGTSRAFRIRSQSLIQEVLPLKSKMNNHFCDRGDGLTTHCYRGGTFVRLAPKSLNYRFENTLNLAHELGHAALNCYQLCDPLIEGNIYRPLYSVVRKSMRPAAQCFHALIAVVYMLELLIETPMKKWLPFSSMGYIRERERTLSDDLAQGIKIFDSVKFTPIGKSIFREIRKFHIYCKEFGTALLWHQST